MEEFYLRVNGRINLNVEFNGTMIVKRLKI